MKYVNNGKDITVQLVPTENNKNDSANGIQRIYYKSPLANSLIGHNVGDIVKIGNLENYVEIVSVAN